MKPVIWSLASFEICWIAFGLSVVAFISLSPPLEVSTMPFNDPSAEVLLVFSFLLFLKSWSIKSFDTKIFSHFKFRTKSLSENKLVWNFSFLMLDHVFPNGTFSFKIDSCGGWRFSWTPSLFQWYQFRIETFQKLSHRTLVWEKKIKQNWLNF